MADIGGLSKLVLAQNVKLMLGENTFATMRQVRVPKTHPESRFNYGLKRDYGHGAPDIGISFVISVTSDAMEILDAMTVRGGNGVLSPQKFVIEYTGNDGKKNIITVMGKLRDIEYIRNDSDQQDPVTADCFIRVVDEDSDSIVDPAT